LVSFTPSQIITFITRFFLSLLTPRSLDTSPDRPN